MFIANFISVLSNIDLGSNLKILQDEIYYVKIDKDCIIRKNYLNEDEITELNRIVTMWLDFAEDQAKRRKQIFLNDWTRKLDEFLRFNDREVLQDHGKVSRESTNAHAYREYELFATDRRVLKEAEGEKQLEHDLEEIAKRLPKRRNRKSIAGRKDEK